MYRDDPSVFYTSLIQLRTDYELGAERGAGWFACVYKARGRVRGGSEVDEIRRSRGRGTARSSRPRSSRSA